MELIISIAAWTLPTQTLLRPTDGLTLHWSQFKWNIVAKYYTRTLSHGIMFDFNYL